MYSNFLVVNRLSLIRDTLSFSLASRDLPDTASLNNDCCTDVWVSSMPITTQSRAKRHSQNTMLPVQIL